MTKIAHFIVNVSIQPIKDIYPDPWQIKQLSMNSSENAQMFASLWLSEGIPFAFRDCPALYELIRQHIAKPLDISPKELTVIGSARLGQSLVPNKLGNSFNLNSDLDWSAVSKQLFDKCHREYLRWESDFKQGVVNPQNDRQKKYWGENIIVCPQNLTRGFIDANKVPAMKEKFPTFQKLSEIMWQIKEKCENTLIAPKFKKSTIRIYNSWNSFIKQQVLNLRIPMPKDQVVDRRT